MQHSRAEVKFYPGTSRVQDIAYSSSERTAPKRLGRSWFIHYFLAGKYLQSIIILVKVYPLLVTKNRYLEEKGPSGWKAQGCASKAWGGGRPQDRTGGAWGQADPGGPVSTQACVHFRCPSSCHSLLQLLTVSYLDVATILVPPCVV